jgi:hypothetical protein
MVWIQTRTQTFELYYILCDSIKVIKVIESKHELRPGPAYLHFMYWRRIVCPLYGAVDFLIVPSKGLYGGSRAIKFLYAPAPPNPTV